MTKIKRDHINEVVKLSSFHLWCDFVSIYFGIEGKQKNFDTVTSTCEKK